MEFERRLGNKRKLSVIFTIVQTSDSIEGRRRCSRSFPPPVPYLSSPALCVLLWRVGESGEGDENNGNFDIDSHLIPHSEIH